MVTGGGHGNVIWLYLFVIVEFVGLYFPLMAILSVDLRPTAVMIVSGALWIFNVVASIAIIIAWILGITGESLDDFGKTLEAMGPLSLAVCVIVHFLPTAIFAVRWITAFGWATDEQ